MDSVFRKIILYIVLVSVGVFVGVYYSKTASTPPSLSKVEQIREGHENYRFINPLLFTKTSVDDDSPEYSTLKNTINKYSDKVIDQNKAKNISVYFRNMDSGEWISINPDEKFSPASMLKVVTLMTTMRMVESDPDFLKRNVMIKGDDKALVGSQATYPAKDPVRSGNIYSVQTLIDHLIIDSDNVANVALTNLVGVDKINKTYEDLDLAKPDSGIEIGYTAIEYSHLFRSLYNGTYLSHSLSEKVLKLLSQTEFDRGLVAGVPNGIIVSHKFGVRTILSDLSTESNPIVSYKELHDCGIVYFPNKPYFICVMTRGNEFPILETVIKDISKMTWDEVDKLN